MRCCFGSSWREWYFDLPRCASSSRKDFVRLPVKRRPKKFSSEQLQPQGLGSGLDFGIEAGHLLRLEALFERTGSFFSNQPAVLGQELQPRQRLIQQTFFKKANEV